jgi:putative ABC transport system permease protein
LKWWRSEGGDARTAETNLQARVPTGLRVQAPSARGERSRDALYSIEQSLAGVSLVTLVAGAFVILNTFLINLTERRRQLAIWRALGATASQVTGLLLREAALLGLAGAAIGIGAGHALGVVILGIMEQVLGGVSLPMLSWTNQALLLALLFGPGMAVAATWGPARRAARRTPLDDLLARGGVHNEQQRRWPALLGLALIASQLLGALGIGQGWLAPTLLAPLMPLGFVGFVLMMPMLILPLMGWARLVLERCLGFEGRLAMRQLERRPVRTSLTVGILSIAMVVGISVGHGLLASVGDTRDWARRVARADFYVRGTMPDGAYAITMAVLPEKLEADFVRLDGVDRVDKLNWVLARAHGERVVILACSMASDRSLSMDLKHGDPSVVLRKLLQGEVVLGTALAHKLGLGIGDEIEMETRFGPRPLRIAGTANDYTIDGMAVYLEWHAAQRLFAVEGVHVFMISAPESKAPILAGQLKAFCAERQLLLHSQAELHSYIDRAVLGVVGLVWALLAMVFVVAALGMVNTLTMNVLEQTRELGMLRAVGLQRRQLRKLVLAQAAAVALLSVIPSTIAGLALAYVINMLSDALLAHTVAFRIDAGLLGGCLGTGIVITLLAALLPARRAARLQPVRALQYE